MLNLREQLEKVFQFRIDLVKARKANKHAAKIDDRLLMRQTCREIDAIEKEIYGQEMYLKGVCEALNSAGGHPATLCYVSPNNAHYETEEDFWANWLNDKLEPYIQMTSYTDNGEVVREALYRECHEGHYSEMPIAC